MHTPWVIAHRGASGYSPENTLAAFERAVELGARFIETDLHLTRDAQFVAIHDDTLDRTTNGHGAVSDFNLAQLRELDAGSWYDREYKGQRIPSLEDIFEFARRHDVIFYLELKYNAGLGTHHALVGALREANNAAHSIVISFDATQIAGIRRLYPGIMTGLLVEQSGPDIVKMATNAGARQLCPRSSLVTAGFVEQAHAADLHVATWTVNETEEMRRVIAAGVNGVMTDLPDRLQVVIEEKQNPPA